MITQILIFLISCLVLILAGSWAVKSLTRLALSLRLSYFILGFILMAFATTIPELLVGITSAIDEAPSLSLGNVLGSNIANLGLILGIVALVKGFSRGSEQGIEIKSKIIRTDILYLFPLVLLPLILLLDGDLSRLEGIVLVGIFLIYLLKLMAERREFKAFLEEGPFFSGCFLNFFLFGFSIFLLILSAKFVVDYGILIAQGLNLPLILIGLSGVALGTSLPELVFSLKATRRNKEEMVLGDLVGACVINSTLVLGVTALISPMFNIHFPSFLKASLFLLVILLIFILDVRSKNGLRWPTGIILLLLYFLFLLTEFLKF